MPRAVRRWESIVLLGVLIAASVAGFLYLDNFTYTCAQHGVFCLREAFLLSLWLMFIVGVAGFVTAGIIEAVKARWYMR